MDQKNLTKAFKEELNLVNYIIEKGIDESRLVAKGYGESEPMVENDTEENKAKNRRAELKVIGK